MNTTMIHKLKTNRQRLIDGMESVPAPQFQQQHALLLDTYFQECFEASTVGPKMELTRNPYALIALGGYGRQEQSVHSDIDLLFLFAKRVPPAAADLVQEMLYPLWNAGFEVGHATRSVRECVAAAKDDFENLTAMLDARLICGMTPLYSTLEEKLRRSVLTEKSEEIIRWLVATNAKRHAQFGDSTHLLKPNLKEGQGGLRDYHTLLWISHILFGVRSLRDLDTAGCLSHEELETLMRALEFVWTVRNRLHLLSGRKCDQLHYEYQIKLAELLGFTKEDSRQAPVERFLGRLHAMMGQVKYQRQVFLYEMGLEKVRGRAKRIRKPAPESGLTVVNGMLNFQSAEKILANPYLLMNIFEESARRKLPLSAEAKRLVKDFLHLVDEDFRTSREMVKAFERVLIAQVRMFNVLTEMRNTGFFLAFLPEFEPVIDRILYNEYHIYPVDRHSLSVVRKIKCFGTDDDHTGCLLCAEVYKSVARKRNLLWAALLHDIGKREPASGHSVRGAEIAAQMLRQRGLGPKAIETIAFLVREHLLLMKAATRRDIEDEETSLYCARKIKTLDRLRMLYLLTVADASATGPKAWNEWTATLLRDLFLKIAKILESGELASHQAIRKVDNKKEQLLASATDPAQADLIGKMLTVMSPRYLLYASVEQMRRHIALHQQLGANDFVWQIRPAADSNTREVTVCAKDRPGLFANIAGVFTLNKIDILDVQVFTWRNNQALDIFTVTPPPDRIFEDEKWAKARKDLALALGGKLALKALLKKKVRIYPQEHMPGLQQSPKVVIDNESSSFFTIIEVYAYDFPGLLFKITDALFQCRLDIWVAKIATNVDQVVDVFYVRDFDGQKVDLPEYESQIKSAVMRVLTSNSMNGRKSDEEDRSDHQALQAR